MPASPIRKLTPFAEAAEKRGVKVFHLNIGQPDIVTPPAILEAVRRSSFPILAYAPSAGYESYRKKLTSYYDRFGIRLEADEIIVTTGSSEAILFALLSCLDAGDELIVPEPFYANYNGFAAEAGIVIRPVTSVIADGFALPSISEFNRCIGPKTRGILICNPNNPTGYLYSPVELRQLKDLCLEHDLYLFSDEAYREFCYEGNHFSAMQLEGMEEHVILLDTISKRYSACGGRLGALITRNRAVLASVMKFAQARLSPPTFAQILAEAAVDLPGDYFDEVKAEYLSRRDLMVKMLRDIPGVCCPCPGGAFYAMVGLPVEDTGEFCRWLLEEFSYENQTVMLAPGAGFYSTSGLGKNEVRIAYVLNKDDLASALNCLREGLRIYGNKKAG
jgi:aspartate aminotransferase